MQWNRGAKSEPKCHALSGRLAKYSAFFIFLILPVSISAGQAPPTVSCDSLAKLALPQATVTIAKQVAAGEFEMAGQGPNAPVAKVANPAFCQVAATLKPSSDSDIKIEVWLPLSGWNGKFVGAGNSGWAGSIPYRNMLTSLQSGYAVAGTNTGHEGNSGAFIIGHPEKLIDYAYRADHEMTVKAKAIVAAYYGVGPKHSYWVGCSLGGLEALIEAKRYPEDYDGIVAGSPLNPITHFNAAQLWPAWVNMKYPNEAIPGSKFTMTHDAALKACATPTGIKQGFIDDPLSCKFDPGVLQCKGDDAPDCLTAGQVDMMRKLYQGPVNPRTGESVYPGVPLGVEVQWAKNGAANPAGVAVDMYKYAVYQDANWDWKTIDYDASVAKAIKEVDPLIAIEPDLNGFLNHGDKLMMYVGGAESLSPKVFVSFYETVLKNAGQGKKESIRLFVNPGVGHCGGGAGCDTFEKLGAIDQWVETGTAPDQLLSSKVSDGKTIRTRPLCAYPLMAKYKGSGNEDEAESFVCAK